MVEALLSFFPFSCFISDILDRNNLCNIDLHEHSICKASFWDVTFIQLSTRFYWLLGPKRALFKVASRTMINCAFPQNNVLSSQNEQHQNTNDSLLLYCLKKHSYPILKSVILYMIQLNYLRHQYPFIYNATGMVGWYRFHLLTIMITAVCGAMQLFLRTATDIHIWREHQIIINQNGMLYDCIFKTFLHKPKILHRYAFHVSITAVVPLFCMVRTHWPADIVWAFRHDRYLPEVTKAKQYVSGGIHLCQFQDGSSSVGQ